MSSKFGRKKDFDVSSVDMSIIEEACNASWFNNNNSNNNNNNNSNSNNNSQLNSDSDNAKKIWGEDRSDNRYSNRREEHNQRIQNKPQLWDDPVCQDTNNSINNHNNNNVNNHNNNSMNNPNMYQASNDFRQSQDNRTQRDIFPEQQEPIEYRRRASNTSQGNDMEEQSRAMRYMDEEKSFVEELKLYGNQNKQNILRERDMSNNSEGFMENRQELQRQLYAPQQQMIQQKLRQENGQQAYPNNRNPNYNDMQSYFQHNKNMRYPTQPNVNNQRNQYPLINNNKLYQQPSQHSQHYQKAQNHQHSTNQQQISQNPQYVQYRQNNYEQWPPENDQNHRAIMQNQQNRNQQPNYAY